MHLLKTKQNKCYTRFSHIPKNCLTVTKCYQCPYKNLVGKAEGRRYVNRTCIDYNVDEVHALGEGVPQVDVVEGDDAALPFRSLQSFPPLQRFFAPHLILVELSEVVDYNGNGQRNHQYATDTANTAYHFS